MKVEVGKFYEAENELCIYRIIAVHGSWCDCEAYDNDWKYAGQTYFKVRTNIFHQELFFKS